MKTQKIIFTLAVAALALGITGCKDESKSALEQTKDAAKSAGDAVTKAAEAAKETGAKVATDVADKAKEMTAPASAKAQELIDSAKSLLAEGKFQDALTKLKAIGGEKLSLSQQSIVDGLKAQIEKALGAAPKAATDAAGAIGTLPAK